MNNPRSFLLPALLLVGYLIWAQWQQDYSHTGSSTAPASTASTGVSMPVSKTPASSADVPIASPTSADSKPAPAATIPEATAKAITAAPHVVVTTDVLRVEIDTHGGNVVVADLLAYPQQPKDYAHPVRLLDDVAETFFEAQSGLVSSSGPAPDHQATFNAEKTDYSLISGADTIEVPLTWQEPSGLSVRKIFVFKRGSYVIEQRQEIENKSSINWTGNAYHQLQRVPLILTSSGIQAYADTERFSFIGAAWYGIVDKFQKISFEEYTNEPLSRNVNGGWIAMLQHYFFAAWIPPANETDQYATATVQAGGTTRYIIRAMSPAVNVAPNETKNLSANLYVGPKSQSTLGQVAPGLELTIDYGVFTIIAQPLYWILSQFHKLTNNWGFAIILLVLLIKAAFYKLSEAQYRSMAKMRKLQPRVESLKERYGDDRTKLNQAMMELYKKEKINPLGGCLPVVIQIPVFFALYWVLLESVELRQAPFIGWIQNLTAPDPYYVLPILNGLAMIGGQMLTPMIGMDPLQAKMMKAMPVIFSVLFAFFPAGLVLYYTVNGSLTLLQQWVITKRVEAADAKS